MMLFLHAVSSDPAWSVCNTKYHVYFLSCLFFISFYFFHYTILIMDILPSFIITYVRQAVKYGTSKEDAISDAADEFNVTKEYVSNVIAEANTTH